MSLGQIDDEKRHMMMEQLGLVDGSAARAAAKGRKMPELSDIPRAAYQTLKDQLIAKSRKDEKMTRQQAISAMSDMEFDFALIHRLMNESKYVREFNRTTVNNKAEYYCTMASDEMLKMAIRFGSTRSPARSVISIDKTYRVSNIHFFYSVRPESRTCIHLSRDVRNLYKCEVQFARMGWQGNNGTSQCSLYPGCSVCYRHTWDVGFEPVPFAREIPTLYH